MIGEISQIPLVDETDVLVCGGGPAGFVAAIAAARNGARTTLLERYGFLGGMASAGMVNPIYGFHARHLQVVTGIAEELIQRLAEIPGGTSGHSYRHDCVARRNGTGECVTGRDEAGCPVAGVASVVAIDAEATKVAMLRMVEEAGVKLRLHTHVVEVEKSGPRINGIVSFGKSGFRRHRASIVIDATGDADVAALAGVPCRMGSEDDGATKPPTLMFRIGNVHLTKDRIWAAWPAEAAAEAGGTGCWLMALPRAGEYTVNSPTGLAGFDPTNTEHLSSGQATATRQVWRKLELLRRHVKGCEDAVLLATAPQLGLRDSRRIAGDYVLTEEDILQSRKFPDGIANGVHPIDLHTGSARLQGRHLVPVPCGDYYQIPYRCLLPQGMDNLLVAGRPVSATFLAQGSLRVMATCMAMGQAAGSAAALAVRHQIAPRQVDPAGLRLLLQQQGAYLGREYEPMAWNQGGAPVPAERKISFRRHGEA